MAKTSAKLHELERIASEVDATHPRAGPLVAAGVMCVIAKRMLLSVAPAGTGKSLAGHLIHNTHPHSRYVDSITRAGMKDYAEELTDSTGAYIIDDLGKTGSAYHRLEMMLGFAELIYTGMMQRGSAVTRYEITGFKGSAIFNCQPSVLGTILNKGEWDATIQDKSVRYYHLYRPLEPNEAEPHAEIDWNITTEGVALVDVDKAPYSQLVTNGYVQWGRARSRQHVRAMLTACAAIDKREEVTKEDARVLKELMRPMMVERIVVSKSGWETGRYFNVGLLCLLIQFASYGTITLNDVMVDYKLNEYHARGLMVALERYWTIEQKGEDVYKPTPDMLEILKKVKPKLRGARNG